MKSAHDPETLAGRAKAQAAAIVARMKLLVGRYGLYRRLFLGSDGEPSADGALFLVDLAAFAHADRAAFADAQVSLERIEGRRDVYFRITNGLRLDGAKLAALRRHLRETEDE